MLKRFFDALRRGLSGGQGGTPPTPEGDPERVRAAQAVLDRLRPGLRADGGDVDLVAVGDDGWLLLAFRGACTDCGARSLTLRAGLQPALAAELDWFSGIREVQ